MPSSNGSANPNPNPSPSPNPNLNPNQVINGRQLPSPKLLLGRDATARLYDDVCTAASVLVRTQDPRDAAAKLRELRPWTGCVAKVWR